MRACPHLPRVPPSPAARGRPVPAAARAVRDRRLPGALRRPDPARRARRVELHARRRGRRAALVVVGGVHGAADRGRHGRHPLRDQVVEVRHHVDRGVVDLLLDGRRAVGRLRRRDGRRRLHHQSPARRPHRRQGVDRLSLRRRAARGRARRAGAAARPAPVLLEERQVGARPRASATRTSRASGSPTGTTTTGTHGESSATGGTSAAAARLADRDDPRAPARDGARGDAGARGGRLAGPPGRPARRPPAHRRGRLPGRALLLDRLRARGRRPRAHGRADRRRRGLPVPDRRGPARATSSSCAARSAATSSGTPG